MNKPPYKIPSMEQIKRMPWNGKRVVSTFSGCGGSSLGYKMAGFRVLWASEFIEEAQATYRANHPSTILDGRDIREVQPEDILSATNLEVGEIDLFDGSPPCSSFSMAGIREEGWGRVKKYSDSAQRTDDLFFEYARLLKGLQPKTFVAENVKGLTIGVAKNVLGTFEQDLFKGQEGAGAPMLENTILDALMDCGYVVRYQVLDAANLGVPQHRQRIIFIGVRRDLAKQFNLDPTSGYPSALPYQYTVRDACPWIQAVYDGKESKRDAQSSASPTILASDGKRPCSSFDQGLGYVDAPPIEKESDISKYAVGAEWDNLKVGEQSSKYFSQVKVDPEQPCPTVCASHGTASIASIVHPSEKRKFSIGELKRICGFPDDFQLTGTYAQKWERLGRAVPPLMMSRISDSVNRNLLRKMK